MGGLSTAEKNRRKRERKKKEREARRQQEEKEKQQQLKEQEEEEEEEKTREEEEIEIEYVPERVNIMGEMESVLQRFQERASVIVTEDDDDDDDKNNEKTTKKRIANDSDNDDDDDERVLSKRRWRRLVRPSVAELKRRVGRPDLVEAHDVTAPDPEFLIWLKGVAGTVPVPRHWGRKRKYLQGKRGYEKPPFALPDFIVETGITRVRDSLADNDQTAKQQNRARVAPKMGAMDVDYRTLYEAFFKHQTKPTNLTRMGDLYYEGKELETTRNNNTRPGGPLSKALRQALGMTSPHDNDNDNDDNENAASLSVPPPWLVNMQRYGPPPSYPNLQIPGLNAPLPNADCQFGYHEGGWGQPPVDNYGRPLYGGNPFDPPGDSDENNNNAGNEKGLVTSDGKTIDKKNPWGSLPNAFPNEEDDDDDDDDDESSDEEMEESDEEEEEEEEEGQEKEAPEESGAVSVLPPPPPAPTDLRKQAGGAETPLDQKPKQLYQILEQQQQQQQGTAGQVFGSDVAYVMPPEGAESVLSKAVGPNANDSKKKKRKTTEEDDDEEDDEGLGKNFKF